MYWIPSIPLYPLCRHSLLNNAARFGPMRDFSFILVIGCSVSIINTLIGCSVSTINTLIGCSVSTINTLIGCSISTINNPWLAVQFLQSTLWLVVQFLQSTLWLAVQFLPSTIHDWLHFRQFTGCTCKIKLIWRLVKKIDSKIFNPDGENLWYFKLIF